MNIYRTKFDLYLDLEGLGTFEVSVFNSNFPLSTIPTASCVLAIGRSAYDVNIKAAVHDHAAGLRNMVKATVWFRAAGEFDGKNNWPNSFEKIFEGRLTGVGYRKIRGKVYVAVNLQHWLADLAFSSTLSEQSHPANPSDYSFAAIYASLGTVQRGNPHGIGQLGGFDLINGPRVQEDLWGRSIKPFFCGLANRDTVKVTGEFAGITSRSQKNDLALAALARIEGESADSCSLKRSKYTPKLSLDMGRSSGITLRIGRVISEQILRETIDSYATTTMWDTLVGSLAPRFMFSVVPLVDTALVVPYVAGLRETYRKSITSNEFEFVDMSGYIPRPIRGMAIYASKSQPTGPSPNPAAEVPSRTGIGGFFAPEPPPHGMLMFRRAPAWLGNIDSTFSSPGRTVGMDKSEISTATTPLTTRNERISGGRDGKTQAQASGEAIDFFNRYAQALYITEALRGRQGMLQGKLRFDISPGSNILVDGSSEQFINSDSIGGSFIGTVVRVSVGINAEGGEGGVAGTGIQIANIRSQAENNSNATSIDRHPLYATTFTGAPMVDRFAF